MLCQTALWVGVLPLQHGEQRSCHYTGFHSSHFHATALFNGVCLSKSILKRVRDVSRVPASTMTTFEHPLPSKVRIINVK